MIKAASNEKLNFILSKLFLLNALLNVIHYFKSTRWIEIIDSSFKEHGRYSGRRFKH